MSKRRTCKVRQDRGDFLREDVEAEVMKIDAMVIELQDLVRPE